MGATRNTGYLENLIQYDASDNVAIATSVNPSYKVTLGGSLLGTSATFSGIVEVGNTVGSAINSASGLGNLVVGNGGASSQGITIYTGASTYGGLNFADATTGGGAYAGYIKFDHSNNSMGFFIGNVSRLSLASTGAATFSGQLTANSFVPTSSTIPTNGMYLSGTNTLGFATNGTLDMTLDANGALGLGTTSLTGWSLRVGRNITGATSAYGISSEGSVQSDVTTQARGFNTFIGTQATTFTLPTLYHYFASQGTFGAGSTVTNQHGFSVDSGLTGATNNYAFFSNIAAGSGRWNLYMNGTANNYMAGSLGIGTTSITGYSLRANKALTGNTDVYGIANTCQANSDATSTARSFYSEISTQAASYTLSGLYHYWANQGSIGAGSTVTSQFGFFVHSSLVGATNNFGFYGNIPSGTNRWNLYMNGTANNYLAGSLGIGATSLTGVNLRIEKAITGGTTSYSIRQQGTVQSDVTTLAIGIQNTSNISASAFTLSEYAHYQALQGTFGAGSTVTNQYGFVVANNLTGATNNFGFYGNIAAGTNRWNLYMNGTAANYLAGKLLIGSTTDSGEQLQVTGTAKITGAATFSSSVYATNYIINEASANRGGLYPYNRVLGSGTDYSVGIFSEGEIFMAPGGGTTKRLVMTTGGNVGIGTTSPLDSTKFGLQITSPAGKASYARVNYTGLTGLDLIQGSDGTGYLVLNDNNDLRIYTNLTERMRITSGGKVGINWDSPASQLSVRWDRSTAFSGIGVYDSQVYNASNHGGTITFGGTYTSGGSYTEWAAVGGIKENTNDSDYAGALAFYTRPNGGGMTERMRINSGGALKLAVNGASVRSQTDNVPEISQADNLHCLVLSQKNASFTQNGFGAFGMAVDKAAGTDWTFAGWYSSTTSDREYQFRGDGQAYADTGWTTPASDYAEYFESVDGTALPFGSTVSLINNKIKIAEEGETVIGVIRPKDAQLFLGNNASQKWNQKYLKNEYGSYIRDAEGHKVLNPEYNPEVEYIPREKRNEWNVVGLVGQIPVTKGQITNPNWVKMRDISDTVEEWLVK